MKAAFEEKGYASGELEQWKATANPSDVDFRFAQELSYGCLRLALSLDYIAAQLTTKKKLSLKLSERILVRMGVYQCCFMDKIPKYAALHETVELAKQVGSPPFSAFLNAILRKLIQAPPQLPLGNSFEDLSVRYSYPPYYIKKLLDICSLEQAKEILEAGNQPSPLLFRIRSKERFEASQPLYILIKHEDPLMGILKDHSHFAELISSPDYYIQNLTPAFLMQQLGKQWDSPDPKHILDLCAAPGGKLLAAHDRFPQAQLYANDVSEEKIKLLRENIDKYGLSVELSCSPGESYTASVLFDLVIVDAPCSNTGVLNKRPEARWRLSEEKTKLLQKTQEALLEHAAQLLKPEGEIWYMTCSILPEENEKLAETVCKKVGLQLKWQKKNFPEKEGWDGGYAAILRKNGF